MNWEKEIMELVPMLRSFIRKQKNNYGYIDEDDVVQECLIQAMTSAKKTNIRNPRPFFISVFNSTIIGLSRTAQSEKKRSQKWERDFSIMTEWGKGESSQRVFFGIEQEVTKHRPITRRVWAGLKRCHGNQSKTARSIGCGQMTVRTEKKRLTVIYEKIKNG
jgi:DNA-directed RNA polymerase specialized sigma24 family protein